MFHERPNLLLNDLVDRTPNGVRSRSIRAQAELASSLAEHGTPPESYRHDCAEGSSADLVVSNDGPFTLFGGMNVLESRNSPSRSPPPTRK